MVTGQPSSNKKMYITSKGTASRNYSKNVIRLYPLDPFGNPIACQPKWMALGEPVLTRDEKVAFGHRFPGQLRLWYKESLIILEEEDVGPPLCHYKGLPVSRNDCFIFKMRAFVRATLADCCSKESNDSNNVVFPYGINVWEETINPNTKKVSYYNEFANVCTDRRPSGSRAVIFTEHEKERPKTSIYENESTDDEESDCESDNVDEIDEFLYSSDGDSVLFTSDEEEEEMFCKNNENFCANNKNACKNDGQIYIPSRKDGKCDQENDKKINDLPCKQWEQIDEGNVARRKQVVYQSSLYQGNECCSGEYCCLGEQCEFTCKMYSKVPRINKSALENRV